MEFVLYQILFLVIDLMLCQCTMSLPVQRKKLRAAPDTGDKHKTRADGAK